MQITDEIYNSALSGLTQDQIRTNKDRGKINHGRIDLNSTEHQLRSRVFNGNLTVSKSTKRSSYLKEMLVLNLSKIKTSANAVKTSKTLYLIVICFFNVIIRITF